MRSKVREDKAQHHRTGTLINVTDRRIGRKFMEALENEDKRCFSLAESVIKIIEKKPETTDIDIKTKVLCYLVDNNLDSIMQLGEDAHQPLIDAQLVEAFNMGDRAAYFIKKMKKEGKADSAASICKKLYATRDIIMAAEASDIGKKSLETETTFPSLPRMVSISPMRDAPEQLDADVRKQLALLADIDKFSGHSDAFGRIVELAGKDEQVLQVLVDELETARETKRSIIPALLNGNFDDFTVVELITLIPRLIKGYEKAGYVYYNAIKCLGETGGPANIDLLKDIAKDANEEGEFRRTATMAIGKILLRGFDMAADLDSWFEKYVKPVGNEATRYILSNYFRSNESAAAAVAWLKRKHDEAMGRTY